MNIEIIFKRLVLIDLAVIIAAWIGVIVIPESEIVSSFSLSLPDVHIVIYGLILLWLVSYLISVYLIYNFKTFGKNLYFGNFILVNALNLFLGPVAMDEWIYILDNASAALQGAILVLLFFSPIKKKFNIKS